MEPTEIDVILGKGRRIQNHAGNKRLREIGVQYRDKYQGQPNPLKTKIRQEIVDVIRASGGRFLELDTATSLYHDVGDKRAREKVRHVLSDNGRSRQQQSTRAKKNAQKKKLETTASSEEPSGPAFSRRLSRISSSGTDDQAFVPLSHRTSLLEDLVEQKKVRQRQQRLLLLRHGATCKHTGTNCPVTPQCAKIRDLWKHLEVCQNGDDCPVKHCSSSKYVLNHYRACVDNACPECGPVRATLVGPNNGSGGRQPRRRSRRISTSIVAV